MRYAPDMMGSLVYAGGLAVEEALATVGTDGTVLGAELERIGYAGSEEPGFLKPHAYIELHIEQGPLLEREGVPVGAVENLQGISWQRVTIDGDANHAGTTPMSMRRDAGHAAARVVDLPARPGADVEHTDRCDGGLHGPSSRTRSMSFPSRAVFTVDLRDPDEGRLQAEEGALAEYLQELADAEGVTIAVERLARFEPVTFDPRIVALVEDAARERGLASTADDLRRGSRCPDDRPDRAPRPDLRAEHRRHQPQSPRAHPGS